jgi:2-haloacid dehalogenase
MYIAIFFDIDDTIFDFDRCSANALARTCFRCGLPCTGETLALFRSVDGELWEMQRRNLLSVDQVVERRAQIITAELGAPSACGLFSASFQESLADEAIPVPDAGEVLAGLHGQYRLYAASNGVRRGQIRRLEKAGFLQYFTDVYVSDQIGREKPDTSFFRACLARSGLAGEQVLMVGDSLRADIQGAGSAGIDACWFHPRRPEMSEKPAAAKYQIFALRELLEIL